MDVITIGDGMIALEIHNEDTNKKWGVDNVWKNL